MELKYSKKYIALVIGLGLSAGLVACSDSNEANVAPVDNAPASEVVEVEVASVEEVVGSEAEGSELVASESVGALSEEDCSAELSSDDSMQFSTKQIIVPAGCQQFTINFAHLGSKPKDSMGHNVVVAKTSDLNNVINDGVGAGAANDYVKPNDERVVAHTKLLGGGEKDSIVLDVATLKDDRYSYVCTYPGHGGVMRGKFKVE